MFPPWRYLCAAAIVGITGGALAWARFGLLPRDGKITLGVRVAGAPVDSGDSPRLAAERRARELLDRTVTVTWEGQTALAAPLGELGASVDIEALERAIAKIGHEGSFIERLDEALQARRGALDVHLPVRIPVEVVAARLERFKEERDIAPKASKLVLSRREATPHVAGRYVDVYAVAEAIERAAAEGRDEAPVGAFAIAPRASSDVVVGIDTRRVVARYETRFGFVGGQRGRAQNVTRAASLIDGVVLMPSDVVSFNQNVGPRSEENGFTTAPEIYKGEMRPGVGGGTCQVASTLHAAAFLGGIDVVERINHSRPSGYIPLGLDATVVYPAVDLKLRNPYDFPIVVHATIDKGTLVVELIGGDKPATVEFDTATVGVANFKRKIEEAPWLPEGKVVKKQKGIRGYSIKKTRYVHLRGGQERVDVTTDVYPPTFEIYLVPPGTNVDDALPPLADAAPVAG